MKIEMWILTNKLMLKIIIIIIITLNIIYHNGKLTKTNIDDKSKNKKKIKRLNSNGISNKGNKLNKWKLELISKSFKNSIKMIKKSKKTSKIR